MRKSKFTSEEIENVLDKIEKGATIDAMCKKIGVTAATIYNWKKRQFNRAELPVSSHSSIKPQSLRELEEENLRLKQLVANLSLEKQDLLDILRRRGGESSSS